MNIFMRPCGSTSLFLIILEVCSKQVNRIQMSFVALLFKPNYLIRKADQGFFCFEYFSFFFFMGDSPPSILKILVSV